MGTVTVQNHTTVNPICLMGEEAGICWGADISDDNTNYKRGLSCLKSEHLRVAEFPQVYLILDGYSARVIRELYTHIGGAPTRLQASTRYIDYISDGFDYVVPETIKSDPFKNMRYKETMKSILTGLSILQREKTSKEDLANLLPLGMTTKIVLRTNARNLIDMSHQRMCKRAYWEFRELFQDICNALSQYSEEWATLIKNYFKPKCEVYGYCPELNTCKQKPNKKQIDEYIAIAKELQKNNKEQYDILKTKLKEQ